MITETEARSIAIKQMPKGSQILKVVTFQNLYILQIIWLDPFEGNLDPFFSVNKTTGKFIDFSISDGGNDLIRQFVEGG